MGSRCWSLTCICIHHGTSSDTQLKLKFGHLRAQNLCSSRIAAGKFPNNRMLGWRPFKDGVLGPYLCKSYKEIYGEVLQVGSALQQLGVKPGSRVGIYGTHCPQWIVAMQACNGYNLICVPLYDILAYMCKRC